MKKFILIICILSVICFTGCNNKNEEVNLNGIGLEELINITIPENYKPESNIITTDNNELISIHYGDGDSSIYTMILSYKGQAVMGSDEKIDDWLKDKDNIQDEIKIKNADSTMYIYPISINSSEKDIKDKSVIEGVFVYKDYLIMVGLESNEGKQLNKEQVEQFYKILNTIECK